MSEKLEMMDKAHKINKAIQNEKMSDLIVVLGLNDELMEGLTLEEIGEVIQVRLHDFMKQFEEIWGGSK